MEHLLFTTWAEKQEVYSIHFFFIILVYQYPINHSIFVFCTAETTGGVVFPTQDRNEAEDYFPESKEDYDNSIYDEPDLVATTLARRIHFTDLESHSSSVRILNWSPLGDHLMTGDISGRCCIWKMGILRLDGFQAHRIRRAPILAD